MIMNPENGLVYTPSNSSRRPSMLKVLEKVMVDTRTCESILQSTGVANPTRTCLGPTPHWDHASHSNQARPPAHTPPSVRRSNDTEHAWAGRGSWPLIAAFPAESSCLFSQKIGGAEDPRRIRSTRRLGVMPRSRRALCWHRPPVLLPRGLPAQNFASVAKGEHRKILTGSWQPLVSIETC